PTMAAASIPGCCVRAISGCTRCASGLRHSEEHWLYAAGPDLAHRSGSESRSPSTPMDELERLVNAYRGRASASARSKLDVLMHVEEIRDPRVVPLLLNVLESSGEPVQVRSFVLKQVRNGDGLLVPGDRKTVAKTIGEVVERETSVELRLQAVLALGEFT